MANMQQNETRKIIPRRNNTRKCKNVGKNWNPRGMPTVSKRKVYKIMTYDHIGLFGFVRIVFLYFLLKYTLLDAPFFDSFLTYFNTGWLIWLFFLIGRS